MKVLLLGGGGDMAVPLLALLQKDDVFSDVIIADINDVKAMEIAARLGEGFTARYCDATDHEGVVSLMKGCDVVFSYVGPFYLFERDMAACAIKAGVSYVSIADDYDAYLAVIELEEEARRKGVKILTGFGNSPGLTQILARRGYNDVPGTNRINVHWCAGSDEAAGPSNLTHLFHIFNGTTLQTLGGKEVRVKTGGAKKPVEFPEPIGKTPVYYTGHAESVSLPRNLTGLDEATLHGGVKPNYIVKLLKIMSALRLFSTHRKRAALARFFYRIENLFASKGIDRSVGRIDIHGESEGKKYYKYFTYVGHIAEITSLPAYTAARWLCQGRFDSLPGGVYAAERLLEEPSAFIDELKSRGIEIFESEVQEV